MSARESQIIRAYLEQHPDESDVLFCADMHAEYSCVYKGRQIKFTLTNTIIKREKFKNHFKVRYEVFDVCGDECGRGQFGVVYNTIGTLSFERHPIRLFAFKPASHNAIKLQHHYYDYERINAQREYSLLGLSGRIQPKQFRVLSGGVKTVIVSRKAEGSTLDVLLDNSKKANLSIKNRFLLSVNLLRALRDQVHVRGIVHRDLKPENIVIDSHYDALIIDYGLASLAEDHDKSACGTINYIAPEAMYINQIATAELDHRSDVYSMARVLSQIWGADMATFDRVVSESGTDITSVILANKMPVLFDSDNLFGGLSRSECLAIRSLIYSMLQSSPDNRPYLNRALEEFDRLRLMYSLKNIPTCYHADVRNANQIGVIAREYLDEKMRLDSTPHKIVQYLLAKIELLSDNRYAIQEFAQAAGMTNSSQFYSMTDIKRYLASTLRAIEDYEAHFTRLHAKAERLHALHQYQPGADKNLVINNLNIIMHFTSHEVAKLNSHRIHLRDFQKLPEKLNRKRLYYNSFLDHTYAMSGSLHAAGPDDIRVCLQAMLGDPLIQQERLSCAVLQACLSFVQGFQSGMHLRLFYGRHLPVVVKEAISAVVLAVIRCISSDELLSDLHVLQNHSVFTHPLLRKLQRDLHHAESQTLPRRYEYVS